MKHLTLPDAEPGRRVELVTNETDLPGQVAALQAGGLRLALVAAHDDADRTGGSVRPGGTVHSGVTARPGGTVHSGGMRAVYLFLGGQPDRRVELHLPLDRDKPIVPSLAGLAFPAGRFEREMRDLYGIVPLGHPLPRRLVRHPHWPAGWYPMRRDAGPPPPFGQADEPFPFLTVGGSGVYEIPVGPIHAGLIEPGHFRFSVVGETILKLKARLWYVHKGIERLFEGRDPASAIELAQRVSGDTAVGHTSAYCRAVEEALGLEIGPHAQGARAILLELERLYNHITDIGALCNDVGHGILNAHAQRVRETLLRLNAEITGHRLLRGGVVVGGAVLRALPDSARLAAIAADIRQIVELALGNSLVAERFTGTATLSYQQARDLGTLGYVARASGVATDARRDHPVGSVGDGGFRLSDMVGAPTGGEGDVLARFRQRVAEIEESFGLLYALVDTVDPARITVVSSDGAPSARVSGTQTSGALTSGVGIVEGWRGTIVHRLELDQDQRISRNKIVDPSFFNWPALPLALAGTIVPDFPLVNKSFNLSYAGNDL